jgi:hypothetical protein
MVIGVWLIVAAPAMVPIMLQGWSRWRASAASPTWPTVAGTVASSRVDKLDGSHWETIVQYGYAVDGFRYSQANLSFGSGVSGDQAKAQAWADRYPAGATVTVHYNPADPSVAVLEPGPSRSGLYAAIFAGLGALASLGVGIALVAHARRLRRAAATYGHDAS